MFAFRSTHPKRKSPKQSHQQHGRSGSATTKSKMDPKRGMSIFVSSPSPHHPQKHQQPNDDDASLDMSLYTTQSKSTIRYNMSTSDKMKALGHSWQQQREYYLRGGGVGSSGDILKKDDDDATEYTTERALKQAGYYHHPGENSLSTTPKTEPLCTPTSTLGDVDDSDFEHDDDEVSSIGGYSSTELFATAKMARFQFPTETLLSPEPPRDEERSDVNNIEEKEEDAVVGVVSDSSSTSSSSSSSSYGHHEYDRSSSADNKKKDEYTGPVDLDESIADTLSLASSSNSWVMSLTSGMAPPQVYSKTLLTAMEHDQSNEWEQEEISFFSGVQEALLPPSDSYHDHDDDNHSIHSTTTRSSTGESETTGSSGSSSSSSWPSSPPPSTSVPVVGVDDYDDEENSFENNALMPFLSTDGEAEQPVPSEEQQGSQQIQNDGQQWSEEDEDVLSMSYAQTMESLHNCTETPIKDPQRPRHHQSLDDDDEEPENVQSMLWDGSPGTLRLTDHELKRHMDKTKTLFTSNSTSSPDASPSKQDSSQEDEPSAWLDGYENWRRTKERQDRYYAKLQKNAEERQRERREKEKEQQRQQQQQLQQARLQNQHQQTPPKIAREGRRTTTTIPITPTTTTLRATDRVDLNPANQRWNMRLMENSTRSAMDQSVDSSIPTLDEASLLPRKKQTKSKKEPRRRKWNIFARFSTKKKREKHAVSSRTPTPKTVTAKPTSGLASNNRSRPNVSHNKEAVLPLGQFLHHSRDDGDAAAFEDDDWPRMFDCPTLDSSRLESLGGNIVSDPLLVQHRLVGRNTAKQRQAAEEDARAAQEMILQERKRIEQRKQQEIERQRRMNLPSSSKNKNLPPKPPVINHNSSHTGKLGRKLAEEAALQRLKKTSSKDGADSTQSPSEFDDSVLEKSVSVCSKDESAFSSLQSKTSSKILAPCVLCNAAERSHISMPCMHFSFCEGCVHQLYEVEPDGAHCPVCNTGNVAFCKVFTD